MKISYAITVCNEFIEIQRLINFLLQYKREEDEIVILFDSVNGTPEVEKYLRSIEPGLTYDPLSKYNLRWYSYDFDNDFSKLKNYLNEMCTGDYIFQIDADEVPNELLIENLHTILETNESDIILVPRVNIVEGITENHIKRWGWKQNDKGWVQWPDHQWRIYKNTPEIKWKNKIHEMLDGYKSYANLPEMEEYALYHYKTIEKQEKQNNFYETI